MNHEETFLKSFLLFLLFQSGFSIDTLTPNQTLADGQSLLSKGEIFELGFFSPGNSTYRYLGIWYNKVPGRTVVWVANRDFPITGTSAFLSIQYGNLLLQAPNLTNFDLTNVSGTPTTIAQLLDSGNLILIQTNSNNVLWQSFDFPTNTILPGMKLGLDRKTDRERFITAWKSQDDPGTGNYSYGLDSRGASQLFLRKGPVPWWRTGPWTGVRWSGVPEMTHYFTLNISFAENAEESYAMYTTVNSSVFSRLVVDELGLIQWFAWQGRGWNAFWWAPKDHCDYYSQCGAYGTCNSNLPTLCTCLPGFELKSGNGSDECVRKRAESSTCGNGEGFVQVAHVKVPDTSMARVDTGMSMKACEQECLRNCSCTAYASAIVGEGGQEIGCLSWYGDLVDTREYYSGGQDLFVRVHALELAQYKKTSKDLLHKKRMLGILVASMVVFLFLMVSFAYWLVIRKRKGRERRPKFLINVTTGSTSFEDSSREKELDESKTNPNLHLFELSTIVAATDNFSSANKLGEGGFGSVYKGCLANGQEIAVKRLSKNSGQGIEEFKNEVMLIAKLQHRNLVRLFGCCIHKEEKMLIYEHLPNKSLDSFIFDESRRTSLDWRKRYDIIFGVARGVLYLHQDSRIRIIHRDLKASNVLLDAVMNPKISDFGMARIFGADQIQANTNRVVGTYGYMSPEYAMQGRYSIKSDVFSFGVLLLEIISGKRNNNYCYENPTLTLIGHVWELWREGKALNIVVSSFGQSYPTYEVLRCIQIGILCVQECAADRPTMFEVVSMLGNETSLPSPKQPAFIFKRDYPAAAEAITYSVNEVTQTTVEAR